MLRVRHVECGLVAEGCCGLLERDAVLGEVRGRFMRVPLEQIAGGHHAERF
jgi:hypothetical protein